MSASGHPDLKYAKTRPRAADKADRKALVVKTDKAESASAKLRAAGRCEAFIVSEGRCKGKDVHTHHMLSGWGIRARGESALAIRKQRLCEKCHHAVTNHTLRLLVEGDLPKWSDVYERWK